MDWNSHIIWSMRTELEEPWDTLTEDIQNIVKELLKYSNKRLKDLKAVLLGLLYEILQRYAWH